MRLNWGLLRVQSGCEPGLGSPQRVDWGRIPFQAQVVGRNDFLAARGLRAAVSCWLSRRGHPQHLQLARLFFPHVDFLQQDDLLHPSRKEEKVSWQDECTPHCVHPVTFAMFYLAGNKHPTLKGRESHRCEHQALEATLRIWHNNLTLTEKMLLLEIKDSYSCPHSKACFLLDWTKTLLDQTLLRFLWAHFPTRPWPWAYVPVLAESSFSKNPSEWVY